MSSNSVTPSTQFKKKTYTQIDPASCKHSINIKTPQSSSKKIVATNTLKGLREEFKRTFLPMLIDVFELRQLVENAKLEQEGVPFVSSGKSPQEILERLTAMKESVLETQRWCDGVIGQIAKGIEEATEAVEVLKVTKEEEVSLPQ